MAGRRKGKGGGVKRKTGEGIGGKGREGEADMRMGWNESGGRMISRKQ